MNDRFPIVKLARVFNTNIFYWNINFSIEEDSNKYSLLFFDLDNALSEIKINATMNLITFIDKYKDVLFYLIETGDYEEINRLMNYSSYLKYLLVTRQCFYTKEYVFLIDDDFLKNHNHKPDLVRISKQNSNDPTFILFTIDETIDYLIETNDIENDLVCKEIFKLENEKTFLNEQKLLSPVLEHTKGNKLTKKDLDKLSFKRNQRNTIHCKNCFEQPNILNEFIYENRCKMEITNYQIVIPIDGNTLSSSNNILKAILDQLYLPYFNDSSNVVLFSILYRSLKILKTKHIVVHSLSNKDILNDSLVLTLINCFNLLLSINFLFTDLIYIKSAISKDEAEKEAEKIVISNKFKDAEF